MTKMLQWRAKQPLSLQASKGDSPRKRQKLSNPETDIERYDTDDNVLGTDVIKDDSEVNDLPARVTDLESALAPIATDQDAIDLYESSQIKPEVSGDADDESLDRLKSRNWTRGKSSIYVDAFNVALDTVLEEEDHLFNEAEHAVFQAWRNLDYQAQYL